jgi:hypothetical protein
MTGLSLWLPANCSCTQSLLRTLSQLSQYLSMALHTFRQATHTGTAAGPVRTVPVHILQVHISKNLPCICWWPITSLRCIPRRVTSSAAAVMLVFERKHALGSSSPKFSTGVTAEQPVLPVAGEVFALRKLLPQTADYDFNVHVMDFQPGEYLNVKVSCAAASCRGVVLYCHSICRVSAGAAYERSGH